MPYIVGILASYMPDSLMLDGTLVVNLDDNELTQSSGDPIAPLPPERYTALFRHLKKLVGSDPSQPYRGSLPLSDSEIESAFLKFQVQLLAKYRDYLEAPSEFVMDKFQKVSSHYRQNRHRQSARGNEKRGKLCFCSGSEVAHCSLSLLLSLSESFRLRAPRRRSRQECRQGCFDGSCSRWSRSAVPHRVHGNTDVSMLRR